MILPNGNWSNKIAATPCAKLQSGHSFFFGWYEVPGFSWRLEISPLH
jgi:hypothetical protein